MITADTKLNEKQFVVSLFFGESAYEHLVEGSDSVLHVPGIMDEWKEEHVRTAYDQRLEFLRQVLAHCELR